MQEQDPCVAVAVTMLLRVLSHIQVRRRGSTFAPPVVSLRPAQSMTPTGNTVWESISLLQLCLRPEVHQGTQTVWSKHIVIGGWTFFFCPRPAQAVINHLNEMIPCTCRHWQFVADGWFTAVNGLTVQLRLVLGENRPLLLSHTLQGEMDQRRIHSAINTSQ